MRTRLITGSCYILVLAAFFALKVLCDALCFDVLVYAFSLIGTFEMLRATKEKTTKAQKCAAFAFALVCIPLCALFEGVFAGGGHGVQAACACFFVYAVYLISLLVIRYEETTIEGTGVSLLSAVYPTGFLCLLTLLNHLSVPKTFETVAFDSRLAVLFVFVIPSFADSLAYVFGRFLKGKFPRKLAPDLSPNKTVVGFFGGLVGGVVGAGILYAIYGAAVGGFEKIGLILPLYLVTGLIVALVTAFGDLAESCIKRKAEIKDMGRLLPGHGGVLDRIDGTLFATAAVYACFVLVYALA